MQAEALSLEDIQVMLEEYVSRGGQMLIEHPQDVLLDSSTPLGLQLKAPPHPFLLANCGIDPRDRSLPFSWLALLWNLPLSKFCTTVICLWLAT